MKKILIVLFVLSTIVGFAQNIKVLNSVNEIVPEVSKQFYKNLLAEASQDYSIFKASNKRIVFIPSSMSKENFNAITDAKKSIVVDFYTSESKLKLKSIKGSFDAMFALWKTHFNNEAIKKTIAKDYKNQSIKNSTYRFTFKKAFDGSWTIQNSSK